MKNRLQAAIMWLYRRMLIIPLAESVSNGDVLRKMETKRHILTIRKRQLELLEHILRTEGFKNLAFIGHSVAKGTS